MSTPASTTAAPAPSNLFSHISSEIGNVVKQFHSEAALVMGVLAATGVTPGNASQNKYTAAILTGYAALTKVAASLKGTA